jgi:hypothetical protein
MNLSSKDARVANLQAANARKAEAAGVAVVEGLQRLASRGGPVNINAVAAEAGVSRGFIYSRPELRAQIAAGARRPKSKIRSTGITPNEASLQARLETALDSIKDLKIENSDLKKRIENLAAQLFNESVGPLAATNSVSGRKS